MPERPLKELFDAMFRGRFEFDRFTTIDPSLHRVAFSIQGRSVFNPDDELKAYLAFLNRALFSRLPVVTEVVFSYRKGFNVGDAIKRHAASKYFLQTDLENFFPSIQSSTVRMMILNNRECCPFSDVDAWVERILELVTVENVLPIGYPTSPVISNSCLYHFDKLLVDYVSTLNGVYTRYADDIIISSIDRFEVDVVVGRLKELLSQEFDSHLSINDAKTKFHQPGGKVKLLGLNILPNGHISVDSKIKRQVEVGLHYYLTNKEVFSSLHKGEAEAAIKLLAGRLNYINTVDKDYLDKLRKKYGVATVDMFLHVSPEL